MKYFFTLAIFLLGCQNSAHTINLTNDETQKLDSLQFDKSLATELKLITKQTFDIVSVVNKTGKESLMPCFPE